MERVFRFRASESRQFADPTHNGVTTHYLLVPAKDIPSGIAYDANARAPNISKRVYKDILKSLQNADGSPENTFHLKNRGITIIANSVAKVQEKVFDVHIHPEESQGIVDGGHTYEIIQEAKRIEKTKGEPCLADKQLVLVEIREGVPSNWIVDISQGLNTSVQVKAMSLGNLAGHFEWLKQAIGDEPYAGEIAWSENDEGKHDAIDILQMMICLNIELFPPDKGVHPIIAYSGKQSVLNKYEKDQEAFRRMSAVLKDILRFHDMIHITGPQLYNKAKSSNKAGALKFVNYKSKRCNYPFAGVFEADHELERGAIFPILSAFRWYLRQEGANGEVQWVGSFENVKRAWERVGGKLMEATREQCADMSYNIQSVGKSKVHWSRMLEMVELDYYKNQKDV